MPTITCQRASQLLDAASCGFGRWRDALRREHRARVERGFTLLELMLAIMVFSILGTLAVSGYRNIVERARVAQAVADIGDIQVAIQKFDLNNGRFPDTLLEVAMNARSDPWGRPYEYLNFANVMDTGAMRKDRNLVPINTDFDLYSMGPDGESSAPLTARPSHDDIVRANDGSFIGRAKDY